MRAFVGSNLFLAGLLVIGGAAIFPVMLYSKLAPENSLTAYKVASDRSPSRPHLVADGFAPATAYFAFISRRYARKVGVKRDNQGFY